MTRASLVDVNVLHSAPGAARAWLVGRPSGAVARWAAPTQPGVLRLPSQPRVMGEAALTPERALHTWDGLVQVTGLQEITTTLPAHAQHLRALVAGRALSPHLWTDAWLAALAFAIHSERVSFNRGFRSFPGMHLTLLQA